MIGASYKVNAWGNWVSILWFAALGCLFVALWISSYEFRQLCKDIHNAYHQFIYILEGING
jgi:hypothetical protein